MHMLMVVFRSSLKERVHELLQRCDVKAFTEVNETVGYGQTGPAEGLAFYPGTNSVILVALDPDHAGRVGRAVSSGTMRRPNIAAGKSRPCGCFPGRRNKSCSTASPPVNLESCHSLVIQRPTRVIS